MSYELELKNKCFVKCLMCLEPGIYYVNSANMHGLCENCAKKLVSTDVVCQDCDTHINIEYLKPRKYIYKCCICNGIGLFKQDCKHIICGNCYVQSKRKCSICLCLMCNYEKGVVQTCQKHKMCEKCAEKSSSKCFVCYCQTCCNHKPDKQSNCNHLMCEQCLQSNKECEFCKVYCNYCNVEIDITQDKNYRKPGCKHSICEVCRSEYNQCILCNGYTKCTICNNFAIPKNPEIPKCENCENIYICKFCNEKFNCSQIASLCEDCSLCETCGQRNQSVTKMSCNHRECDICCTYKGTLNYCAKCTNQYKCPKHNLVYIITGKKLLLNRCCRTLICQLCHIESKYCLCSENNKA